MNRADLNFEVGDCVKVRKGVGDPDWTWILADGRAESWKSLKTRAAGR